MQPFIDAMHVQAPATLVHPACSACACTHALLHYCLQRVSCTRMLAPFLACKVCPRITWAYTPFPAFFYCSPCVTCILNASMQFSGSCALASMAVTYPLVTGMLLSSMEPHSHAAQSRVCALVARTVGKILPYACTHARLPEFYHPCYICSLCCACACMVAPSTAQHLLCKGIVAGVYLACLCVRMLLPALSAGKTRCCCTSTGKRVLLQLLFACRLRHA